MKLSKLSKGIDELQYYYFCFLVYLFPFAVLIKREGYFLLFLILIAVYAVIRAAAFVMGKSKAAVTLLPFSLIVFVLVLLIISYHIKTYHSTHIFGFARYFSLLFIFIVCFSFDENAYKFSKRQFKFYVAYVLILLCGWVLTDYVLIQFVGMSPLSELMWPHSGMRENAINLINEFFLQSPQSLIVSANPPITLINLGVSRWSYNSIGPVVSQQSILGVWRPLGLIGKPSVTTAVLIFLFMLYYYLNQFKVIKKIDYQKIFIFLLLTFTIFFQDSGLGYVLYVLMIFSYMIMAKNQYKLLGIVLLMLFLKLVYSGLFYRIGYFYILNIIQFSKIVFLHYLNTTTFLGFLFGNTYPYVSGGVGFVFVLSCMGLLYLLLYFSFILSIAIKGRNKFLWAAILLLIISNIHYTTVFYYPEISLILSLLVLRVYMNEKSYKWSFYNLFRLKFQRNALQST